MAAYHASKLIEVSMMARVSGEASKATGGRSEDPRQNNMMLCLRYNRVIVLDRRRSNFTQPSMDLPGPLRAQLSRTRIPAVGVLRGPRQRSEWTHVLKKPANGT